MPSFLRFFLLGAAMATAACHDLSGFSGGEGEGEGVGPVLRTQATAKASAVTSFELTPAGGTRDGDLLYYVVLTLGGRVVTPPGLTPVETLQNQCIPSLVWVYSRAATESMQATQKFELDAPGDIEATLLVIGGVDPAVRAHAVKGIALEDTSFQADALTVGASDAPAHVLFTVLWTSTTGPAGSTSFASNGAAAFFTLAAPKSGPLTLPAMPVNKSCGTVITVLLHDR